MESHVKAGLQCGVSFDIPDIKTNSSPTKEDASSVLSTITMGEMPFVDVPLHLKINLGRK